MQSMHIVLFRSKLARTLSTEAFSDSLPINISSDSPQLSSQSSNWSTKSENAPFVLRLKSKQKMDDISKLKASFQEMGKDFPETLLPAIDPKVSLVFFSFKVYCNLI